MIDGIGPHNNTPPNIMKQDLENDGKYNKLIFDFIAKNDGNEDNNFTRKEINLYNKIINWVKKYNISDDKIQELIKNPGKILNFITNKETPEPTKTEEKNKTSKFISDTIDMINDPGYSTLQKINIIEQRIDLLEKAPTEHENDIKVLQEELKNLKNQKKELEAQKKEAAKAEPDNNIQSNNIETNITEENTLLTLDQTNPELAQNDKSPKEDEKLF